VKKHLPELCAHLLQKANSKRKRADLVEKSKHVAIQVESMRGKVRKQLQTIPSFNDPNQKDFSIEIEPVENLQT